jgi:hypothetical protein
MTTLARTIEGIRARNQRAGKKLLNEQNSKATLIEPVLRALGWDVEDIEFANLHWVDQSNNRRLPEPPVHRTPASLEQAYCHQQRGPAAVARRERPSL